MATDTAFVCDMNAIAPAERTLHTANATELTRGF